MTNSTLSPVIQDSYLGLNPSPRSLLLPLLSATTGKVGKKLFYKSQTTALIGIDTNVFFFCQTVRNWIYQSLPVLFLDPHYRTAKVQGMRLPVLHLPQTLLWPWGDGQRCPWHHTSMNIAFAKNWCSFTYLYTQTYWLVTHKAQSNAMPWQALPTEAICDCFKGFLSWQSE